jgi:hypothetical protein
MKLSIVVLARRTYRSPVHNPFTSLGVLDQQAESRGLPGAHARR